MVRFWNESPSFLQENPRANFVPWFVPKKHSEKMVCSEKTLRKEPLEEWCCSSSTLKNWRNTISLLEEEQKNTTGVLLFKKSKNRSFLLFKKTRCCSLLGFASFKKTVCFRTRRTTKEEPLLAVLLFLSLKRRTASSFLWRNTICCACLFRTEEHHWCSSVQEEQKKNRSFVFLFQEWF